jgi:hypothetical protein
MVKKVLLMMGLVALVAFAGTVPTGPRYKITLSKPAIVQGTELKAGEYRISFSDTKLTITSENGKNPVEANVKVETEAKKFDTTVVRYDTATGKAVISEIRVGGTKTRLILN